MEQPNLSSTNLPPQKESSAFLEILAIGSNLPTGIP